MWTAVRQDQVGPDQGCGRVEVVLTRSLFAGQVRFLMIAFYFISFLILVLGVPEIPDSRFGEIKSDIVGGSSPTYVEGTRVHTYISTWGPTPVATMD